MNSDLLYCLNHQSTHRRDNALASCQLVENSELKQVFGVRDDSLFNEAFYNWALRNGVESITSDNVYSSKMENPIKCELSLHKLKQGIIDEQNKNVHNAVEKLKLKEYDDTDAYQQGYMWALTKLKSELAK